MDKRILLVRTEYTWLSSISMESVVPLLELLKKHYSVVEMLNVNSIEELARIVDFKPDLVFLGMKFITKDPENMSQSQEKIWLPNFLDSHNIAYTGSSKIAHKLEINKDLAKQKVHEAGLDDSIFFMSQNGVIADVEAGAFPLFVKPSNRGGGAGINAESLVHNNQELHAKVSAIFTKYRAECIAETYLSGREISVAIVRQLASSASTIHSSITGFDYLVMPIEIIASKDSNGTRMLGEEVKKQNLEIVKAVEAGQLRDRTCALALSIFEVLGARDYGRIDIRLDSNGNPHFLEANLTPSLIDEYANMMKASKINESLTYSDVILQIVELALHR